MTKEKNKTTKLVVSIILAILVAIAGVVTGVLLFKLAILPVQLTIGAMIALIIIGVLALVLVLRRKRGWVFGIVLSVIYLLCCGVGSYYLYHTNQAVDEIITPTTLETDAVSIFVLKDDPAQDVSDIEDYTIGIMRELDRENTDYAISQIEEQAGFTLKLKEYDAMDAMIDALKSGEIGGMLLNNGFLTMTEDMEGYENTMDEVRAIITISIETEVEEPQQTTDYDPNYFAVYISGIDTYGGVNAKSRSDVNIIMAVNTQTKQILLLSTPRDYYVPLTISGGVRDKLTHAGIYGVDVSRGTLENLYNTEIPYYLRMNFSGFINIIDALGGVDVYSPESFTSIHGGTYQEGYNHLNGEEALSFARERYSFASGDRQRGKNQMEVIRAMIDKCQTSSLLLNYQEVMQSLAGSFQTNLEQDRIAQLVSAQIFEKSEWNVVTYSVDGTGSSRTTYSMPNRRAYVMIPNESTVDYAKELLRQVKDGETLVQE